MTPSEFQERFQRTMSTGESFRGFPPGKIEALGIAEADKAILREVGFPEDAAPFLDFRYTHDEVLEKPSVIDSSLAGEFDRYRIFGGDGSGNLISIDDSTGRVVYHDHDRGMEEVFINSTLRQFAVPVSLCRIDAHR